MVALLTKNEFATAVRVSRRTVERWIADGKIVPGYTPGGRPRFTDDHVRAVQNGADTWRKHGRKRAVKEPEPELDPEQVKRQEAYVWVRSKLLRRSLRNIKFK